MKLLLDQGLPRSTVSHLQRVGIESVHVGEIGLAKASDARILDFADQGSWTVVTLDADFHVLLARVASNQNNHAEELRQYNKLVELKPDDAQVRAKRDALAAGK